MTDFELVLMFRCLDTESISDISECNFESDCDDMDCEDDFNPFIINYNNVIKDLHYYFYKNNIYIN